MKQTVDTDGKIACPLCGHKWRYAVETVYAEITVGKRKRVLEDTEFIRNTDGTVTPVTVERVVYYPHKIVAEFDQACISEWQGKDRDIIVLDHYDGKNNIKYYKTVCAVVLKDRARPVVKDRRLFNTTSASIELTDRKLRGRNNLDW